MTSNPFLNRFSEFFESLSRVW